jgi:flagellar M-ring protein FliF
MNTNINEIGNQLAGLWKQLGLNQRVSLVLSGLLVLAAVTGVTLWSSRSDYALLYGKLPEAEAAKVTAALDDAKVPYRISTGGGAILVPAAKVHLMRMQLAAKGIPRGDGVGFEIFDKPNFGISDFIQRANYLRAIQGELARTISQVDSVESARVLVVMPENRLLVDQQKKPTASVFVRVRGNGQLPTQTVNAIRFLVANSVEGLQPNFVSIIDNLGNVLSENQENDSITGLTSTQLAARKSLEQYLSKKAEDMLGTVLGPGQAVVRVAAEINFDSSTKTEEKYDPDVQVTRISTINDENTENTSSTIPGGAVGVVTNSAGETNIVAAAAPTPTNHTKKKVVNNQYELNKTTSNLVQAAGGLRRLSAAVFIAARTEGSGAAKKTVARTPADLEKLKRVVQSALGIMEGDVTRRDQITLEEMPFNDQPVVEMTRVLDQQQKQDFWWNLAGKFVYPAIAVAVLLTFWQLFRKTPNDSLSLGLPLDATGSGRLHQSAADRSAPPTVTVEVMNRLLRENPANMTHAIRSWMDKSKNVN